MPEANWEEQLEATVRERAGIEAKLEAETDDERKAQWKAGLKACDESIKWLSKNAKAPAQRAEVRPAPEPEKRGPGRPRKAVVEEEE